jgi:hypothetical protein
MARLAWMPVERIEHDGVGAEQAQLCEVVKDLLDRSVTGQAPGTGDR